MANPEHVEIVKNGWGAISEWRKKHYRVRLDLTDANLMGGILGHADLTAADLGGAELGWANLEKARLSGANLSRANLVSANLNGADLSDANLEHANLADAFLKGTELSGASLRGSRCWDTTFADVDLSNARGLSEIEYAGPNSIGVDTLVKSRGKIPESFLRGCGVPDAVIQHLPYIFNAMEPLQFYSCFLSHSTKDEEFVKRLHGRLEQEKLRVWYAPEDLRGGRKLFDQIDEAIRVYDRLLLVLSEHSMNSEWVQTEIKGARKKERAMGREVLFPIALAPFEEIKTWRCLDSDSGEDLAEKIRAFHVPSFCDWKDHDSFEKGFADLMRDLRREDARLGAVSEPS